MCAAVTQCIDAPSCTTTHSCVSFRICPVSRYNSRPRSCRRIGWDLRLSVLPLSVNCRYAPSLMGRSSGPRIIVGTSSFSQLKLLECPLARPFLMARLESIVTTACYQLVTDDWVTVSSIPILNTVSPAWCAGQASAKMPKSILAYVVYITLVAPINIPL